MQDYISFRQQSHRLYLQLFAPLLERYGLTQMEMDILLYLANHPPHCTAAQLISHRGLTKSHVCRCVERLAGLGFLEARRDGRDRRVVRLKLLPAADAAVDAARAAQQALFHSLWRGVAPEEDAVLERVRGRLSANLKEGISSCC